MLESREPINQKQIWFAYPVGLREGGGTFCTDGSRCYSSTYSGGYMLSNQKEYEVAMADFYKAQQNFVNSPTRINEVRMELCREIMFQAEYYDLFTQIDNMSWLAPTNIELIKCA